MSRILEGLLIGKYAELDIILYLLILISAFFINVIPSSAHNNDDIEKSIILLFDSTGSMRDNNKIEQAQIAAKNVFRSESLNDNDEVALIVFDACDHIEIMQPFTTDKSAFVSMIDELSPNDGTPLYEACEFAKKYMIENSRGRVKKIMLFTDGLETCAE